MFVYFEMEEIEEMPDLDISAAVASHWQNQCYI